MKKRIAVLGSTGSIGRQTLEVARELTESVEVVALSANNNLELLAEQSREFGIGHVCIGDARAGSGSAHFPPGVEIYGGIEGLCEIATLPDVDMVAFALFGAVGLKPLARAIEAGKDIAFATKEALVAGGELVMGLVRERGVAFLPIDSEHNSIWRCLKGRSAADVRRVILSASGGPFRGYTRDMLASVSIEDTISHPIWTMGRRISVNSATMMNKALELIEAHHLFGLPSEKIGVIVHPQGIVHGMVEMADGSLIAHLSRSDMRIPIRCCLSYPSEPPSDDDPLDLSDIGALEFEHPDEETFVPLALGRRALGEDWTYSVCLNAANEVLVDKFLAGELSFVGLLDEIAAFAEQFHEYKGMAHTIDSVIELDREMRARVKPGRSRVR